MSICIQKITQGKRDYLPLLLLGGADMCAAVRRFPESGMAVAQAARRMDVPDAYIERMM